MKVKPAYKIGDFDSEEARFLREADKEEDTAIKALQYLLGDVSIEECRAYWALHRNLESSRSSASKEFGALFKKGERDYALHVGLVLKGIAAYHTALAGIRADCVAQAILDREFEENELVDAVRAQGVVIGADKGWYDNMSAYSLEEATVSFSHEMDSLLALETDMPLASLKVYLGALSALLRQDRVAAARFLDDLLLRIGRETSHARFSNLKDEKVQLAARLVVSMPEYSMRSLEAMAQALPAYQAVASARLSRMLGERFEFRHGHEQVQEICSGLERLAGNGVKAAEVGELVFSVANGLQQEMFSLLADNPAYAAFWRTLRKSQTDVRKYAAFLLNYAHMRTGTITGLDTDAETCFKFVERVASGPAGINIAKALVESDYSWASDSGVYGLLSSSSAAHPVNTQALEILARCYLRYGGEGAGSKQAVVLGLGRVGIPPDRLKAIIRGLDSVADKELEVFAKQASGMSSVSQLERFIAGNRSPQPKALPLARPASSWVDLLCREYDEHRLVIREAYEVLQSHRLEGRLRNMWATQPESVVRFAFDIVTYRESEQMFTTLENPSLYADIKEWLRQTGSESFGRAISAVAPNGNLYQSLHAALTIKQPAADAGDVAANEAEQGVSESLPGMNLQRIVIWGKYSAETQERIEQVLQASGMLLRITFYSMFRRAKSLPIDADAVFYATLGAEHSPYYALKAMCAKRGVPFFHINQPGYEAVVSMVKRLEGQPA